VQFIAESGAEFDQPALTISTSWRGLRKPKPKPSEIIARTWWRMRNVHRGKFQWDVLVDVSA